MEIRHHGIEGNGAVPLHGTSSRASLTSPSGISSNISPDRKDAKKASEAPGRVMEVVVRGPYRRVVNITASW